MTIAETSVMGQESKTEVAELLQNSLADMIDLALQCKQAHWNVVGPRFRSLHLQLDEITEAARGWADDVAERIVALDATADGRLTTVTTRSGLEQMPSGYLQDDTVVKLLIDRLEAVAGRMRVRVMEVEKADPVTQDMLIEITFGLEKFRWMVKAQATSGR
ncbi:MAG: DNA starvation/stationary phase protection protein [Dehalococcoidia bacterium]